MKILSWNIYKRNKKLKEVVAFIESGGFDVVCLQEVPIAVVERFTALSPHSHVADEIVKYRRSGRVDHLQLVILSWLPLVNANATRHSDDIKASKKYSQFDLDFQSVEVAYQSEVITVQNVHFKCVAGPKYRLQLFTEVVKNLSAPTRSIICGDFNTIGRMWTSPFLYRIFRYSTSEIMLNESKALELRIKALEFQNVFAGTRTYVMFPIQLDYILVSPDMQVVAQMRHKKRYGSDHFPIQLQLALLPNQG